MDIIDILAIFVVTKMNTMKNIILIILSLFVFISCTKQEPKSLILGNWIVVGGETTVKIDNDIIPDSMYVISYNDNLSHPIFENTPYNIDYITLGITHWNIIKGGTMSANAIQYKYKYGDFSNIIDVVVTPTRRIYKIVNLSDSEMILETTEQYIPFNGGQKILKTKLLFHK